MTIGPELGSILGMNYTVYQITNTVNGKIYVGIHQTEDINDSYMGNGKAIMRSVKKYGVEVFTKVILHNFDSCEEMVEMESLIVNEEFVARSDTYNITLGGGYPPNHKGKERSAVYRARLSAAKIGTKASEETKLKMSKAGKGRKRSKEATKKTADALRGIPRSEDVKRKISESLKGKHPTEETRLKLKAASKLREKITCPHCGQVGFKSNIIQWHLDNCKHKPETTL